MPHFTTGDGVRLYYEETGTSTPIVFVHEFAGDCRAWEAQMRHFGRRHRCIAFNARGYPPSDVPDDVAMYSQARAVADIAETLDRLEIEKAHCVGLSMGGFAAMHFGLDYAGRALSVVIGGVGFGAEPDTADSFRAEVEAVARRWEDEGAEAFAPVYGAGPGREQLENKDPRGFAEFIEQLGQHSALGAALTLRGVQMRRPSPWDLRERLARMTVPALILHGDEDRPALPTGVFLKQTIPTSGLVVLPRTGHTANLEEPAAFNAAVQDFIDTVDAGRWTRRDKRTESAAILLEGAKD